MTRLPVPTGDANSWGTILNAFLGVSHNSDGSLGNITITTLNSQLSMTDPSGVVSAVFAFDGSGYFNVRCHSNTNDLIFTDDSGNRILTLIGASLATVVPPGSVLAGQDGSYASSTILFVDSPGNTSLQAHATNNQVRILDSSGATIASFSGTNKIATFNGGQIDARTPVANTNYTILASDYIVAYTSLSAGRTATLPAAAAGNAGQTWIVKDEAGSAATNNITVKTSGGTIDGVAGGTGKVINTNYGILRVYSNGTNYFTF